MSMSLLLLTELHALAGTVVWVGGPRAPEPSADATVIAAADVSAPKAWGESDDRAIAFLKAELSAVRPLADVFDGELQIMVRLGAALEQVRAVRDEDRPLLYAALTYQGFAVHRYFQDKLDSDPGAQAYVTRQGGRAEVTAWIEAVALDPERAPTTEEIPDQSSLLAYQELRARHLLTSACSITAPNLPPGGRLVVDGREAATDLARVLAGRHLVAVTVDGQIRARADLTLAPGEQRQIIVPATADELSALAGPISATPASIKLSPAVVDALSALEAPVVLTVTERRGEIDYLVNGSTAERVEQPEGSASSEPRLVLRAAVGAGWLYDGEYLLQNYAEGAPNSRSTVNAAAPLVSASFEVRPVPVLALGGGVDLAAPLSEYQTLPVGDSTVRLRLYGHVAIGHPYLQLTVGALLPWRVGVGGRLNVPIGDHLAVQGAYVYGIGRDIERESGAEFEATDASMAWLGAGWRWQGLSR